MNITPLLLATTLLAILPAPAELAVCPTSTPAPESARPVPRVRRAGILLSLARKYMRMGEPLFLAPFHESDEAEFAAALPNAYWRCAQLKLGLPNVPAHVRPATVGDVLQHWEQFRAFAHPHVGEADRAEFRQRSPQEELTHVWVVDAPLPGAEAQEPMQLVLPGLGGDGNGKGRSSVMLGLFGKPESRDEGEPESVVQPAPEAAVALLQCSSQHGFAGYAYRPSDASPLGDAEVSFTDEAGQLLSTLTVKEGFVQGELPEAACWVTLRCGKDSCRVRLDHKGVPAKPHPHAPDFMNQWTRATVTTDRRVYRPGDVVRVLGVIREFRDRQLHFPQGVRAELRCEMPVKGDKPRLVTQPIEVAADGTYMTEFTLPESLPGVKQMMPLISLPECRYAACVSVPIQQDPTLALQMEGGFSLQGKELCAHACVSQADGRALTGRELHWELSCKLAEPHFPGWEDYVFGDSRPEPEVDPVWWNRRRELGFSRQSRSTLDAQGRSEARFTLPPMPFPRLLELELNINSGYVETENGMYYTEKLRLDPAELYVGLRRESCLSPAASRLPLELVLVTAKGKRHEGAPVDVELELRHHPFIPGRYGCGLRPAPKGEVSFRQRLSIPAEGISLELPLEKEGAYDIIVRGRDARGQEFASALRQYAWEGSPVAPWMRGNAQQWLLRANKKRYSVGETARVCLPGEVEGEAIISVTGPDSQRLLRRRVTAGSRWVEIPLLREDGRSPRVNIALLQGCSPRLAGGHPAVQKGSCHLWVGDDRLKLNVRLDELPESLSAGASCEVSGRVVDAQGKPVPYATVFAYAKEVGTTSRYTGLSRAEFSVDAQVPGTFSRAFMDVRELPSLPDPAASFSSLWHREPLPPRQPTPPVVSAEAAPTGTSGALWQRVTTDAQGRFCTRLTAPQGFAEYQVIALACGHCPEEFGCAGQMLRICPAAR